jgi:hypothetical protein
MDRGALLGIATTTDVTDAVADGSMAADAPTSERRGANESGDRGVDRRPEP